MRYLGYYDLPEYGFEHRDLFLSARTKMDYVMSAFNALGADVEIISASHARVPRFCRGRVVNLPQGTLRVFPSLPWGGRIARGVSILFSRTVTFLWLLAHVSKGEPLLVYHSLGYARLVRTLKALRGCRLVLEVEEVYADVTGNHRHRAVEQRLFRAADAFILPTTLLMDVVAAGGRPCAVAHGTYAVEEGPGRPLEDGRIHVVYAGTFDPRKGGALASAAAAEFLDERYHVHIIGFGTVAQTEALNREIEAVSSRSSCRLTYDGMLAGDEYLRFLQSCHLGLSTQHPDAEFNLTSFPSKVLSYLANGLRVVSIRLKVLEESGVGDLLYYYDENTPQALAQAIREVDLRDTYDSRGRLRALDVEFRHALAGLLGEVDA